MIKIVKILLEIFYELIIDQNKSFYFKEKKNIIGFP